jgi:tripartite-type tricarboxylate transporter receptor subunit TctC
MKVKALFFVVLLLVGVHFFSAPAAYPQRYPDHSIQLVIPYVPGATGDITARMLAEELEKILSTKVVPMNKPGASAVLGTDAVIKGKKDGYTLLYAGASALIYAPISNPEVVHYDPHNDVEPLGFHYYFPQTITVRSDAPWKSFPELVDYAKKNPGKLRVSTIGIGSTPHFILEMIQSITGAQFTHIPFKGGESVMTALLGGHVEVTCDGFAKLKPHADAGKMKVLLITNKMPAFPEMPTINELGYKESLFGTWFALYAPKGVPEEVKKILVPAVEKAVKNTKTRIDQMGSIVEYKSPSELKRMTDEEYKQALVIAAKIGLRK